MIDLLSEPRESTEQKTASTGEDSWIRKYWRPFMAWQYGATCLFDFIMMPLMLVLLKNNMFLDKVVEWVPLTLKGGGIYHVAMGAIIGVSAYSRGIEKVAEIKQLPADDKASVE